MSRQVQHREHKIPFNASFFFSFVVVLTFSIYITNNTYCIVFMLLNVSQKHDSCLRVSIKGDSNDAVWFPVYSLLVYDDKMNY